MYAQLEAIQRITTFITIITWLLVVFSIVCSAFIFEKAGLAWWKCLIPIYNIYCQFRIIGMSPIFMLVLLVPMVNFVLLYYMRYRLNRCFGMTVGMSILFMFFSFIGNVLLAFSKNLQYEGAV